MKKLLALVIALVMLLAAIPAIADTLEVVPGTPANCPIESFKVMYNMAAAQAKVNFVWDDGSVSEDGFDVYTCRSDDGSVEAKVYTVGGNVSHIIGESSGSFSASDYTAANQFGVNLGAVLAGGGTGMLMVEDPASINEKAATYQSELQPLIDTLQNGFTDLSQLNNGMASTTVALGYPTGLSLVGDADMSTLTISLTMKVYITSADGQLNIVQ